MTCSITADALIFDVDGVLIDTRDSFRALISLAVAQGWSSMGNLDEKAFIDLTDWVSAAKKHSQYNDDYHIVTSLLAVASRHKGPLAQALPSLDQWKTLLEDVGSGGPEEIHRRFATTFSERVRLDIRSLCSRLYLGSDTEPGLWRNEKPLLRHHWRDLPLPCGIYTGRFASEVQLALEMLNWQDFPRELIISDEDYHKPDPRGLEVLCQRLAVQNPLFFGDTMSDWQTRESFGCGTFVAIGPLIERHSPQFPSIEDALTSLGYL